MVRRRCGKRQLANRWANRCNIIATYGTQHSALTGNGLVTASNDYTARVWEAPLEEPISEQLIDVVKLLPAWIGHLDFDANGVLKPVSNSRVTECRDQILIELKQPWMRGSFLAKRIEWFLADQRTRSINPTSGWDGPQFHPFDDQLAWESVRACSRPCYVAEENCVGRSL